MTDYIELGPDAVIREGDEYAYKWHPWATFRMDVQDGPVKVSDFPSYSYKFRRPRSIAIRDAALELLRCMYATTVSEENMYPQVKALREALGVTVEELRRK